MERFEKRVKDIKGKKFLYGNLKKNKDAVEGFDKCAKLFYALISPSTYAAHEEMQKAIDMMDEAGMIRHDLKKWINRAEADWQSIKMAIQVTLDTADGKEHGERKWMLWCDVCNSLYGKIESDVDKLQTACANYLGRFPDVERKELKLQCFVALVMLSISSELFNDFFDKFDTEYFADFRSGFKLADMRPTLEKWQQVIDIVTKGDMRVDFAQDATVLLAHDVIYKRFINLDFMDKVGMQAIEYNEENFKEEYAEMTKNEEN